jgi:hypothetical protein
VKCCCRIGRGGPSSPGKEKIYCRSCEVGRVTTMSKASDKAAFDAMYVSFAVGDWEVIADNVELCRLQDGRDREQ